jgi:hypothetical protein
MDGGHDTYISAAIIFPFGLLSSSISENWEIPFLVMAFVQYSRWKKHSYQQSAWRYTFTP